MRTRGTAPALVVLLALAPTPLRAEGPPPLAPGARVRVTEGDARGHGTLTGTLRMLEAGALILDRDSEHGEPTGTVRAIPRDRIVRLEILTRPPDRKKGALKGLGVGLLAGAALILAKTQLNNGSAVCNDPNACGVEVALGAALGGGIGMVVGARSAEARWREIPLPFPADDTSEHAAVGPPPPDVSRRWR